MIATVGVTVKLDARPGQFNEVWDARILVAARQILMSRHGVVEVEFDPSNDTEVLMAVAIDQRYGLITTLVSQLTHPQDFHFVYAAEGGWKTQLLTLQFAVTKEIPWTTP